MNALVKKLLNVKAPLLITGPTGSGKSQLAKKIFENSSVYKEKFLTLHLASIKEDLLESELFGHKKGSFTGAVDNKNGYLKEAGTGTLFLDEIGELSLEAQKKLLYVLEEKKFTPVGSTESVNFQGRIIAATNRDLKAMVKEGSFREDLYFRLSVFHLELKEIAADKKNLEIEIDKMFIDMKEFYGKRALILSPELKRELLEHSWKGNYRELKNCLEFVVALAERQILTTNELPTWFFESAQEAVSPTTFLSHFPSDYNRALESFEELYFREMFEKFSGKVNETARVLGISKTTLISKARKYGINTLQMRANAHYEKSTTTAA